MVPPIKREHLPLYIGLFAVLVIGVILATLYLDGQVHEVRQGNEAGNVALTVAQRAAPMTIAALAMNFLIIELWFGLFVDLPKSHFIQRRWVMIHNWLEERRKRKEQEEARREQKRRLRRMHQKQRQIEEAKRILRELPAAGD